MIDFLQYIKTVINKEEKKPAVYLAIVLAFLLFAVSFFDQALFVGLLLLLFLTVVVVLMIYKAGVKDKKIYLVFLMGLLVHFGCVLLIYYGHFRPFGGGADFEGYHQNAVDVMYRFLAGNFSLHELGLLNDFPVLIGIVYAFTLPAMIIGQLFTVWLAAVSIILAYLIVLEIGGTKKMAFLTSLIIILYPSYLYFGSVLLKDTVVIPLVLAGLLLSVKMLKNFGGLEFLLFFIVLTGLTQLRFYVGFALLFSFIICWFLTSSFTRGDRIIYGLTIIFLLGFSPWLLGYGYYGNIPLRSYLNRDTITKYREVVYAPPIDVVSPTSSVAKKATSGSTKPTIVSVIANSYNFIFGNSTGSVSPANNPPVSNLSPQNSLCPDCGQNEGSGAGSSFAVSAGFNSPQNFIKNYLESFTNSILGPFPWQLRYKRHLFFLTETIPWYFLIYLSLWGAVKSMRKNGVKVFLKDYRFTLPLLLFSIMAFGALSLYINNFGIIVRIRMPMFMVLLCAMSLGINVKESYFKKIHEKISHYWGRGIHWLSSIGGAFTSGK